MGDDRGGSSESGETILVNPVGIPYIKRIVVYTFIFEGVAKWSETNAVVKVTVPGCEDIIVQMGQQESSKRFCAIASIEMGTDNSMEVKKLVTFHDSHSDCDRKYGWGFNYSPGSK
jgi:tellurite resistance protein TerA